jgi:hypothetical protein
MCCLSFDIRPLITLLDNVLSVLRYTASDYPVGYCVVCPSITLSNRVIRGRISKDRQHIIQQGNQRSYIEGQTTQYPTG